jgi:HAD superfamily hydrolase (TIGR01459 family)
MRKEIVGIRDLYDRHDLFLLDQFGVLHDGQFPYPGALAALADLKAAGKRTVIISNSGKRARFNAQRMERIGFPRDAYDELVTSGEVAWHILCRETAVGASGSAQRCFVLTSENDYSAVEGLNVELVGNSGDADVVMITASGADRYSEEHYREILAPAAIRDTPCICTNPDRKGLLRGQLHFGPGRIAEIYQELGGHVRWLGKPYPEIYRFACALVGDIEPSRVVCVGDSVEHDIAGARDAGFASVLVRDGIAAGLDNEAIDALERRHGAQADFTIASFVF